MISEKKMKPLPLPSTKRASSKIQQKKLDRECKMMTLILTENYRLYKAKRSNEQSAPPQGGDVSNVMQKFGLFKLNTGVSLTNNTPALPLPTF